MPLLHGGENHIMDSLCSQGGCTYPSIHKSYFIEEREWEREKENTHKGKEKKMKRLRDHSNKTKSMTLEKEDNI